MSGQLTVEMAGPAMSLQDMGRPGYRAVGMTEGGAADRMALHEGAALLGQPASLAALEMAGIGGAFRADQDTTIALTGADMSAKIEGEAVVWNASHALPAGAVLSIGGARNGSYGYLHVAGGFDAPVVMGSRAAHLACGIGTVLETGAVLPLGGAAKTANMTLPESDRFGGGTIRVVASMQTDDFDADTLARFEATAFKRDARANRMGVRMDSDGDGFSTAKGLSIVSEVVVPGDIQISGDGAPYVLMYECQTTGGYPRIGSVLPCDLPRVAQAQTGAPIRFQFVSMEEAIELQKRYVAHLAGLPGQVTPLIRDPALMRDLLSYQLISGAVSATASPFE